MKTYLLKFCIVYVGVTNVSFYVILILFNTEFSKCLDLSSNSFYSLIGFHYGTVLAHSQPGFFY